MATFKERLRVAAELYKSDVVACHDLCVELLNEEPNDPMVLFLLGQLFAEAEKYGLAVQFFTRVTELEPKRAPAWNNLGMALEGLHMREKARQAFREAMRLDPNNPNYPANLAVTYLEHGEPDVALAWAKKALAMKEDHAGARGTLAFASLALGDWKTGWANYDANLGGKFRKEKAFGPRWDGKEAQRVVFYGEQGLGDEIQYASCLPDVKRLVAEPVIECDHRLEGLFRSSFPWAEVHGTRREELPAWAEKPVNAQCALGSLPQFVRPTPGSCPRTPYLTADPERCVQWRALFDSWPKKRVIGLCWSGGRGVTHSKRREIGLEAFRPLIEVVDAHFVSLQYRDPAEEIAQTGLPVRHFPWATGSANYDDTAALVAELDMVVGIHTSAQHLAGALGVPGVVLVPSIPSWNYAQDEWPWYGSARLYRQKSGEEWSETVKRLTKELF